MPMKQDPEILEAALIGLQHKLGEVHARIAELRDRLGGQPTSGRASTPASTAKPSGQKRTMSASARHRIALAQKKRWAAYKAEQGKPAGAKTAAHKKLKRVISAEGRARIIAATKKRWAAFRKAQAASAKPTAKKAAKSTAKKAPAAKASAPAAVTAAPAAE